jgi:hypothetical protein
MINHPHRSKTPVTKITKDIARKVLAVVDAGLVSGIGEAKPGKMCVEAAVCYALGLPHGDDPACVSRPLRSLKIRLNDSSWSSDQARAKGLRRLAIAQLGSAGFLDDGEFIRRVCDLVLRKVLPGALRVAASVHKSVKHKEAMIAAAVECESHPAIKSPSEARPVFLKAKAAAAAADAAADAAAYAADAAAAYAAAYAAYAAAYAADAAAAYAAYADAAYAAAEAAAAAAYAAAYAADAAAYAAAEAAAYAAAYDAAAYAYAAAYDAAAKKKSEARDKSLATFCEWIVQILIDMKAPGCQWLDLAKVGERGRRAAGIVSQRNERR